MLHMREFEIVSRVTSAFSSVVIIVYVGALIRNVTSLFFPRFPRNARRMCLFAEEHFVCKQRELTDNQENNRMCRCDHTRGATYPSFFPSERSTLIISYLAEYVMLSSRFYNRHCFYRREEELAERKIGPIDSGMLHPPELPARLIIPADRCMCAIVFLSFRVYVYVYV